MTFLAQSANWRSVRTDSGTLGPTMKPQVDSATGETANLGVNVGDEVLFLSQVETYEAIRAFFPPGTRAPMHSSGIGKALLAWYPEEKTRGILDRKGLELRTCECYGVVKHEYDRLLPTELAR